MLSKPVNSERSQLLSGEVSRELSLLICRLIRKQYSAAEFELGIVQWLVFVVSPWGIMLQ
jgi:hypothetical protein